MAAYDYDGGDECVVLCPTRENPEGAVRMLTSFNLTVRRIGTEIVLVVDEDDPDLPRYRQAVDLINGAVPVGLGIRRPDPPRLMVVKGGNLTKATNEAAQRVWPSDVIIGHVGDDHIFRTPGWDNRIREVLAGRPGFAYGNDGRQKQNLPTAVFVSAIIPRTLGWLALPTTRHLCIDTCWKELGEGLERLTYLPDLDIRHVWAGAGEAYNSPQAYTHDRAAMQAYRDHGMQQDLEALRRVI